MYTGKSSKASEDVKFTDKDQNTMMEFDDFLNLMITQLQNQDFTNPVDDAEYMGQMAQLSMLNQMQQVTKNSQYNFAASLLGKVVTVTKVSESGDAKTETGYVDSVSMKDNELKFSVNGGQYTMNEITQIYDNAYYQAQQLSNLQTVSGE
jgi:flagellar hook assembly protein FlgD